MGLFKKVGRGIKKVVRGIAKGVKKVVKGVGGFFAKLMNKLGPIGSIIAGVALSFALPAIGGWIASGWQSFVGAYASNPVLGPVIKSINTVIGAVQKTYGAVKGALGIGEAATTAGSTATGSAVTSGTASATSSTMSDSILARFADIGGGSWEQGLSNLGSVSSSFPASEVSAMTGEQFTQAAAQLGSEGTLVGGSSSGTLFGAAGEDFLTQVSRESNLFPAAAQTSVESGSLAYTTPNPEWTPFEFGPSQANQGLAGLGERSTFSFTGPTDAPLQSFAPSNTGIRITPEGTMEYNFPGGGEVQFQQGTTEESLASRLKKALPKFGGVQPPTGLTPTAVEAPDAMELMQMAMAGTGASGSTSWAVPNLNPMLQDQLNQMAEQQRMFLRSLGDRSTVSGR